MLIHSIISQNDIFFTDAVCKPIYKNVCGGFLEIDEKNGVSEVRRLYSTNPHLYLDKRFSPYNIIE